MKPLQPTFFPRPLARIIGALLLLALLTCSWLAPRPMAVGQEKANFLTSRPAQAHTPPAPIKVGQNVVTGAGERRRLRLPDGAILFVNQHTQAQLTQTGKLTLDAGEVYVEVPITKNTLTVVTPQKELTGAASHFGVRVGKTGTGVVVARGSVQVKGVAEKLSAGQQLSPGQNKVDSAPRLSQVFDWTRELMLAAESPLVPGSEHAGGALVAVDPNGQQAKLELRKFVIDVHIEDGFARTTIDQTYFNQQAEQLEGTFYFPLPPDASLSRLAMYVNGILMEGGMAERDHARQTYEQIRYYNRDPALLEWVDGSTFKMRVFPIEARQEKRIVLSYSQALPNLNGQMQYRFPAGHSLQKVRDWSLNVRVAGSKDVAWSSPSHTLAKSTDGKDLILKGTAKDVRTDKDVVVALGAPAGENLRFSSTTHDGAQFLMMKYRPDLDGANAKRQPVSARDWVFLFEASGDRDPLLARVQIDVIRHLLHHAGPEDRFNILTANTRVKAWSKELVPVNTENVLAALAFLEATHLVGALDLGQAFSEVEFQVRGPGNPTRLVVHVGSGIPAMGERRHAELIAPVSRTTAHYVGVGVGRRWERSFMKEAARRTRGHFTQINPDEPIAWRAFELFASLNEPKLMNIAVGDAAGVARFHVLNQTVAQGEEICAIAQLRGTAFPGRPDGLGSPSHTLLITGELDGKPWRKEIPVKNVVAGAAYLPRTWAKLEIDELLAKDPMKNKDRIVDLSKSMYVMTPFTSLLVLENDDMYVQYKVDRGRKDHWAMYPCPDKIDVVYEPLDGMPDPKSAAGKKPSAKQVLKTLALGGDESPTFIPGQSAGVRYALGRGVPIVDGFASPVEGTNRIVVNDGKMSDWTLGLVLNTPIGFRLEKEAVRQTRVGKVYITGNEVTQERVMLRSLGLYPGQTVRYPELKISEANLLRSNLFEPDQSRITLGFQQPLWGDFEQAGVNTFTGGTVNAPAPFGGFGKGRGRGIVRLLDPAAKYDYINELAAPMARLETLKLGKLGFAAQLFDGSEGLETEGSNPNFLYRRPTIKLPASVFYDLTAYAPGVSMTMADVQAVLEAEARPTLGSRPGQIDAGARKLFDKARSFGWKAWKLPVGTGVSPVQNRRDAGSTITIYFNGDGLYAYERIVSGGIREKVMCDGQTLLHIYPQLGLGASRTVSRFHRTDFADMVPFFLPAAEDLARGADLKLIGERTVAIVPHQEAGWLRLVQATESPEKWAKYWLGLSRAADGHGPVDPIWRYKNQLVTPKKDGKPLEGKEIEKLLSDLRAKLTWVRVQLVFAADGSLAERQVVKMPKGEIIARRVLSGDGTVKVLDAKGKEVSSILGTLTEAKAPDALAGGLSSPRPSARPDMKDLVILPLPYRTAEHVMQELKNKKVDVSDLRFEDALPLLAAHFAAGNANEANQLFRRVFHAREQRQLGFYVLLAACGNNLDSQNGDVLAEHIDNPVAQYLALHSSPVLRKHASQWAMNSEQWQDGFLQHLGQTHAILQRWENSKILLGDPAKVQAEKKRALDYVKKNKDSAFGWALLCLMQERTDQLAGGTGFPARPDGLGSPSPDQRKLSMEMQADLAKCWELFKDIPSLSYAARYENARSLFAAGDKQEARKRFLQLHEATLKDGFLPAIDQDIRHALAAADGWTELITKSAAQMIARKHRHAVLALARQCWPLEDQALAQHLLELARADLKDDKERVPLMLAQIDFLMEMGQNVQADNLLQDLLREPDLAKRPDLWRLAGKLADRRDMPARGIECLEKALDLEFQLVRSASKELPTVVDLREVREEYARLLAHYQGLADAMTALQMQPPEGFLVKVVKTADRWRALDNSQTAACTAVAGILQRLERRDLGWDYLTTPIGLRPNEAEPWWELATTLSRKGSLKLADRAYLAACQAEPTNAQYLWERAQNLHQAGELKTAQGLYRQLAEGTWQPRFQGVQAQARLRLQGK